MHFHKEDLEDAFQTDSAGPEEWLAKVRVFVCSNQSRLSSSGSCLVLTRSVRAESSLRSAKSERPGLTPTSCAYPDAADR